TCASDASWKQESTAAWSAVVKSSRARSVCTAARPSSRNVGLKPMVSGSPLEATGQAPPVRAFVSLPAAAEGDRAGGELAAQRRAPLSDEGDALGGVGEQPDRERGVRQRLVGHDR